MAKTILGKKIGMTQIFTEEGVMIPVTVIEARPNKVIQIKTKDTDGYSAVQLGFLELKENRANKPTKGHFKRWDAPLKKYLTEVRLEEGEEYATGQEVSVADFEEGRKIDVTGTSKGKGTQGNIKRHGHHRGPVSHGSKHKRLPGALAAGTYPSRVFKGNDGPGRMGRDTVTVQNLDLVKIIPERNILMIKGAVPGGRGGIVCVRYAVKAGYPDDVRLAVKAEYIEEVEEEVVEPAVEEAVLEESMEEEAAVEAVEEPAVEAEAEATEEPATEEPATEPETEEPAAEEPAAEEPAEKDPETVGEVVDALEKIVEEATEALEAGAKEVLEEAEKVIGEAKETIEAGAEETIKAVEEAAEKPAAEEAAEEPAGEDDDKEGGAE